MSRSIAASTLFPTIKRASVACSFVNPISVRFLIFSSLGAFCCGIGGDWFIISGTDGLKFSGICGLKLSGTGGGVKLPGIDGLKSSGIGGGVKLLGIDGLKSAGICGLKFSGTGGGVKLPEGGLSVPGDGTLGSNVGIPGNDKSC